MDDKKVLIHKPLTCACAYKFYMENGEMHLYEYIKKCSEHNHLSDIGAFNSALKKNREASLEKDVE